MASWSRLPHSSRAKSSCLIIVIKRLMMFHFASDCANAATTRPDFGLCFAELRKVIVVALSLCCLPEHLRRTWHFIGKDVLVSIPHLSSQFRCAALLNMVCVKSSILWFELSFYCIYEFNKLKGHFSRVHNSNLWFQPVAAWFWAILTLKCVKQISKKSYR